MSNQELQIKNELPKALMISSFSAIFFILALLPFIAWLLEYKDTISAPLTITTKATPIDVFAKSSGELVLLVENNVFVRQNTPLALIKNSAAYGAVLKLKATLEQPGKAELAIAKELSGLKDLKVGPIKPALIDLVKATRELEVFLKTDQHKALINSRKEQITLLDHRKSLLQKKAEFLAKDKAYAEKFAEIDKNLLENEVIAVRTYDLSNREKIGKEMANLDNETLINALDIEIKTLQQERIEIQSQFQAEKLKLTHHLKDALQLLKNTLTEWELNYLIKAGIEGVCIYKDHLNDFTYVEAEEKLFSLNPKKNSPYFGLVKLPMAGAGKVKNGQEVYVKLNNFPYMEFGVLKGKIAGISSLPFDREYNVRVTFPNGFISSYGDTLPTSPLMYGMAEVVVEKKSLYNRIAEQIKSFRYNR